MSKRQSAIWGICLSLSAMAFGCSDDSVQEFVSDIVDSVVVCDPAKETFVCDGDNMKVCAVTSWKSVPCPSGCKDGQCVVPEGVECIVTLCDADGKTLNQCEEGKVVPKACKEHEKCIGNACLANESNKECQANETRCASDNSGVQKCTADGKWGAVEACGDGQKCDIVDKQCKAADEVTECLAEQISCVDGSQYKSCVDGHWSEETTACASDKPVCQQDRCVAEGTGACQAVCDGEKIKACVEGQLGESQACDTGKVCVDDGTGAQCVDSDAESQLCLDGSAPSCVDGSHSKSCVDGQWKVTVCQATEECREDTGLCTAIPKCKQGDIKCTTAVHISGSVDKYVECGNNGDWDTQEKTCAAETPLCDRGITPVACVAECKDGATRCSAEGKLQTCLVSGWQDNLVDACTAHETCSDGKCLCNEGATKCNIRGTAYVACGANGAWDTKETACEYGCNSKTGQCHECSGNAVQCLENGDFQICENNAWKTVTNCGSKESCNAGDGAKGCVCSKTAQYFLGQKVGNGEMKCDATGANIVECVQKTGIVSATYNYWEVSMGCGGADMCEIRNSEPICKCESGNVRCDGQSLQKCSNGAWVEDKVCSSAEICDAEKNACVCSEGAYQCTSVLDGTKRQKCSSGVWTEAAACTGDMQCSSELGGVCVRPVCNSLGELKESMCYNNNVMECVDGQYMAKESCGDKICQVSTLGSINTATCQAQGEQGMCVPTMKRCSADGSTIEVCKMDGFKTKYVAETVCESGKRCEADGSKYSCELKVCNELESSCAGDKVVTCVDNALKEVADCGSAGMKCSAGACVMP